MKTNGRKNRILSLGLGATALFIAGVFSLDVFSAHAENGNTDKLFSPVSYEEYLPLTSPSDIAVSERYTAIADGNKIYLYDKTEQAYQTFTHSSANAVTKLQFDEEENLYYLDQRNLYLLRHQTLDELSSNTAIETNFSCSTFLIHDDVLYFTDVKSGNTQLWKTVLVDGMPDKVQETQIIPNGLGGVPVLAYWNDELYFTNKSLTTDLYKFNPETTETLNFTDLEIASFNFDIVSMSVSGGTLGFTTNAKEFYAYSLPRVDNNTLQCKAQGDYGALTAFHGGFYVANGNTVTKYVAEQSAFTDFEISANSNSPHRLNGARDICVNGDSLLVADSGNMRVSVFSANSGELINNFPVEFAPYYISCGTEAFLIADQTQACIYNKDGEKQAIFKNFQGNITGVASVYDKHYLLTENSYFYALAKDNNGVWQQQETKKYFNELDFLTADIYGNLYTAHATYAYRFTESEFCDPDEGGIQVLDSLPLNTQKISVDHDGNLYALAGNQIYKNGNTQAEDFSSPLVYSDNANVNAFAFGAEENQTFLLCENNYIIETTRLNLPTLKTVQVNGADKEIFSKESAEFIVVDVAQNALLVSFDLQTLQGADYFPYAGYSRAQTPLKALELGQSGEYSIIAVYDESQKSYQTYYTHTAFTSIAKDYHAPYESAVAGYITSEVTLYKFPYLNKLLTADVLPRGAQVEILGELSLDHEYFEVRYQTADGTKTGYIPRSFVAETNGKPPQAETKILGNQESNRDALFRLVYILLGLAAIAVLANYLLLRKQNKG